MLRRNGQWRNCLWALVCSWCFVASAEAQKKPAEPDLIFPPTLPDGQKVVTDGSEEFLKPPMTLQVGVAVAVVPPTVDFLFYPGQDYPGNPWSNWGDSLAVDGKY